MYNQEIFFRFTYGTFLSQSVVDHATAPKHVGGAGFYTYVNICGDTYLPTFLLDNVSFSRIRR